ncbi:MAG TPA: ABC transporter substrate-binding protein [Candidatus Sulfotelmatobacter sp.]|nr:ABC transporter substrate-binding protein [Candidatus Sulfotelmatobacter sp.]
MTRSISRRRALRGIGVAAVSAALPLRLARADAPAITLGTLTPMTGAGGNYGPTMRDAVAAVVEQVNGAGGVLGRRIALVSEDDETNPEAGVRAAHKLIDVDKVPAIIGTWASAVTTAVAPLCWESKTFLTTVSGADSITLLPHQGYLVRTQPNTVLQGKTFASFALELGAKKVYILMPQTPFTESMKETMTKVLAAKGATCDIDIYDAKKTSYRSEVDQALRSQPDTLYLGGYSTDTAVLLRDIYRAGFKGRMIAQTYSIDGKLLESVPHEATEGIYCLGPSPATDSGGYKKICAMLKKDTLDPYSAQTYDHANLVLLAMAKAGAATGTAIRDTIRKVSQGAGVKVDNAPDGLKLLAQGKDVNYEGASGPCDFDEKGDILSVKFRYDQVKGGKFTLLKIA